MQKKISIVSVLMFMLFMTVTYAKNSFAIRKATLTTTIKSAADSHTLSYSIPVLNVDLELDEDLSDEHLDVKSPHHYLSNSTFKSGLSINLLKLNLDKILFSRFFLVFQNCSVQPIYLRNQVFII